MKQPINKDEKLELSKEKRTITFFPSYRYLRNTAVFICLMISLVQGAGWNLISGATGLDISAIWLLGESIRDGRMADAGYITVYGPLGFLDWTFLADGKLLFFSISFRIIATTATFWVLLQMLNLSRSNEKVNAISALLISTLICTSLSPAGAISVSFLIMSIMVMFRRITIRHKTYLMMAVLVSILFLIKLLYFVFASAALTFIIFKANTEPSRTKALSFLKIVLTCISATMSLAIFLTFSPKSFFTWLIGYAEMSRGYTAMYAEEVGRLWEYPAFFLLTVTIILSMKLSKLQIKDMLYALLLLYFAFRYGFVRHDGHSIFTFTVVLAVCMSMLFLANNALNQILLVCTIACYIIVKNFSVLTFLDFTSRVNSFATHIKLVDNRFFQMKMNENETKLIQELAIPTNFVETIGNSSVTILPLPETIPNSFLFELVYPPQPQLFAAYTNWLDSQNKEWIRGEDAPRFLLERGPLTIDGRYPSWDSPSFQVEKFCNYVTIQESEKWLLSEKLLQPRCSSENSEFIKNEHGSFTVSAGENEMIVAQIDYAPSIMSQILGTFFKDTTVPMVIIDGNSYRFIPKNSRGILLAVGAEFDRDGVWSLGSTHQFQFDSSVKVKLFRIQIVRN